MLDWLYCNDCTSIGDFLIGVVRFWSLIDDSAVAKLSRLVKLRL